MEELRKKLKKLLLVVKSFFKKDLKIVLVRLYLLGLVISVILVLLFATFPSLVVCSQFLGLEFCTPTGIFLGLIISIPGYIIAGNLLARVENIPWLISLLAIVLTSLGFYYYLGLAIDKFKKADIKGKVKVVVVSAFAVLLVLLLYLI